MTNWDSIHRTGSRSMQLFRRLMKDERGVSAIEFGLVAPFFLLLLIGSIDIARGLAMHAAFGHAAQEGARYAAVHGNDSLTPVDEQGVRDFIEGRLTYSGVSVTIDVVYQPNATSGSTVTVRVISPFYYLISELANLDPFTITGESSMIVL